MSAVELDAILDVARTDDTKEKEAEPNTPTASTHTNNQDTKGKLITFFVPDDDPTAMERIDTPSLPNTLNSSKKSFKKMALKCIERENESTQ